MEVVFEILKYTIPSAIVFIGVYFVLQNFLESEQKNMELKYRSDNIKLITPIKLQAYERLILYLERISLSYMVMRVYCRGMTAMDLLGKMLMNIRSEYEHNMAQQLYISSGAWKMVKSAKEETIKVINSCTEQLNDAATGLELSQFIVELVGQVESSPTEVAIEALKREVNRSF